MSLLRGQLINCVSVCTLARGSEKPRERERERCGHDECNRVGVRDNASIEPGEDIYESLKECHWSNPTTVVVRTESGLAVSDHFITRYFTTITTRLHINKTLASKDKQHQYLFDCIWLASLMVKRENVCPHGPVSINAFVCYFQRLKVLINQ